MTEDNLLFPEFRPPAKPMFSWQGGKRLLAERILSRRPETFRRYWEPFVGGAAVFFHLDPEDAYLSDLNPDLTNFYLAVRDHPRELIERMDFHAPRHSPDYFCQIRNQICVPGSVLGVEGAACFLYMMMTCFRGKYYVGKNTGTIHSGFGNRKKVEGYEEKILEAAIPLRRAEIGHHGFHGISPEPGDLVYCDPPYHLARDRYCPQRFEERDQTDLRDTALRWRAAGASVLISNSPTEFIRDLYSGPEFETEYLYVTRGNPPLGSKAGAATGVPELLVRTV